jgi:hypothetical protein
MIYLVTSHFFTKAIGSYNLLNKVANNNQVTLEEYLTTLQSPYIWNIYKQLTNEMLEKTSKLTYADLEKNFKRQIMEQLADVVLNQTVSSMTNTLILDIKKGEGEQEDQRVS